MFLESGQSYRPITVRMSSRSETNHVDGMTSLMCCTASRSTRHYGAKLELTCSQNQISVTSGLLKDAVEVGDQSCRRWHHVIEMLLSPSHCQHVIQLLLVYHRVAVIVSSVYSYVTKPLLLRHGIVSSVSSC